jgi:thymidylate synthase ThyX
MQEIGKKGYQELNKVVPSFIRRAEPSHKYQQSFTQYSEQLNGELKSITAKNAENIPAMRHPGVRLISYDPEAPVKVAAALLFANSNSGLMELQEYCRSLPEEQLNVILDSATNFRENRRHKSPRAAEHAYFTFEIVADFGIYRDLQRHRVQTQERQLLTCDFGFLSQAKYAIPRWKSPTVMRCMR